MKIVLNINLKKLLIQGMILINIYQCIKIKPSINREYVRK